MTVQIMQEGRQAIPTPMNILQTIHSKQTIQPILSTGLIIPQINDIHDHLKHSDSTTTVTPIFANRINTQVYLKVVSASIVGTSGHKPSG